MHEGVNPRRAIPAVSKVLQALGPIDLPRPIVVHTIRQELAALRKSDEAAGFDKMLGVIRAALERYRDSRLRPVINGTGVILHTNLGRAPLGAEVAQSIAAVAASYSNLELDITSGGRGGRASYLERNLAILCGAEAATVVNNCAAALVLVVRHFTTGGREVIVSRGELVQIGGGFRIGEMLAAAGATLREVGATNRTSLEDYESAINANTGLILTVHRSNFFMEGFVESTSLSDLARLARRRRVPLLADLGSGALESYSESSDEPEPTPSDALKKGADLVCFSGDKLFGGPQAGIIAGRRRLIAALKREPIFRALRCDKLCLTALQATVDLHLFNATPEIPALALLRIPKDELRARAAAIFARLRGLPVHISMGRGTGRVGGGTLPRSVIPSVTIDIVPENCSLEGFATAMREGSPPVMGYISGNAFKLDLRTIFPRQDEAVVDAIRAASARPGVENSAT
jgi:L-seryl-tRNA(Ser) seleniumtransferase